MITWATPLAQSTEQATSAETPEIVLAVAVIGVLGVALGGVIQLASQRWVVMYDRMIGLRSQAGELSLKTVQYAGLVAQIALAVEGARADLRNDPDNKDETNEVLEKYLQRLNTDALAAFQTIQTDAIKVMSGSDHRLSEYAGEMHSMAVVAQNEVASMFQGRVVLSSERAQEIETGLIRRANVLLNMIAPRKWERYWRFRGEEAAAIELQKLRIKQLRAERERFRSPRADG